MGTDVEFDEIGVVWYDDDPCDFDLVGQLQVLEEYNHSAVFMTRNTYDCVDEDIGLYVYELGFSV